MKSDGQQLTGLSDEARQRLIAESVAEIKRALTLLPHNVKPEMRLTGQEWATLIRRGLRSAIEREWNAAAKKQVERNAFVDRLMANSEMTARLMRKLQKGAQ